MIDLAMIDLGTIDLATIDPCATGCARPEWVEAKIRLYPYQFTVQ
jgi:hypothetical protein